MGLRDKFTSIIDNVVSQGSSNLKGKIAPVVDYFLEQAHADKVFDLADNLKSVADYFLNQSGNFEGKLNSIADYIIGRNFSGLEGRLTSLADHVIKQVIPSELYSFVDSLESMFDFTSGQMQGEEELTEMLSEPEELTTIPDNGEQSSSARTEDVAALVNVKTGDRFLFRFNPEPIQDTKENNIAEINIPGMSHPRLQFANGGNRTLSFTAIFHYGNEGENVPYSISTLLSWLYPEYEGERLTSAPPKLKLVFGDTWQDQIWIMKSCNITRQRFDKTLKCTVAQANIELVEFIEKSIDMYEVQIDNE